MKNQMIKVGAAVPSLRVADPEYNAARIIQLIHGHIDCGLLVFPELSLTGYTCGDLFQQDCLLDATLRALGMVAEATESINGVTVAIGLPLRFENAIYNCMAFISEGKIDAVIPKTFIPTYSEFYESRWFTSGKVVVGRKIELCGEMVPFGIDILAEGDNGILIGADICEDLWVADKPSTHACLAGANIIVNLSASDEIIGKQRYRRALVEQQSASCYCAYVYASSGTEESSTDLVFSGHCMIAENGVLQAECIFPALDHVETALIDLDAINHNRYHQSTFVSEDNAWYRHVPVSVQWVGQEQEISVEAYASILQKENRVPSRMPFVPMDEAGRAERCKEILRIQANGLATRVRSSHIYNLVIGISGGLDSTLALLVCHEAKKIEPKIHIIAVTMPNEGNTSSHTYENALALMHALTEDVREAPIGKEVSAHLQIIGHPQTYQGEGDIAYENAQARMRTYILMDIANMENGLVVGTGDLSELALGWCTYNGDHMSMYGVNSSVPKTLVQFICRTYAENCGDERLKNVLISIVETPISPELTPSNHGAIVQKTEEKIGKYDLNDFFLYWVMRYGFAPDKIMAMAMVAYSELDKEQVRSAAIRFFQRFFHQQFKRSCLPDGPKIGSVTLSPRGDWRMPSDASVDLWINIIKQA